MFRWREKFAAFGIHFLVTLVLAACAAALIFFVWFPAPFEEMVGGTKLFMLVIGCDLALGPLISLVIYNSSKSRRELIVDYTLVGAIQLAALIYGISIVSVARPVYVAFVTDRLEVITAVEIEKDDLEQAQQPQYKSLPKFGPVLVGTHVRPEDKSDALSAGLAGRDVSMRPRFYVPYDQVREEVKQRIGTIESLEKKKPQAKAQIEAAVRDAAKKAHQFGWLPVKHRTGFWTALVDSNTAQPLVYFNLDPY
jgi:hypothetical protein